MRPSLLLPLLAALPLVLSACGSSDILNSCRADYQRPDFAALRQGLAAARQRWQALGIQDYSYEFSQFAAPIGLPKARITVQAGQVVRVEKADTRPGDPAPSAGRTVKERFDDLAASISDAAPRPCAELAITYAAEGYPLTASSGTALKNLADGNGFWTISNFTRL